MGKKTISWFKENQFLILTSLIALLSVFLCAFLLMLPDAQAQSAGGMKFSDPLPANAFIELAKIINPIVVNISTAKMPRRQNRVSPENGYGRDPFFDMFEQFFGPQMPQRPEQALGTGFIIRANGLILTNNHVIADADVIKVQLTDKDTTLYTAEVIGRDPRTDIALIKIDAKKPLPVATLGSSANLQVGEWVAAVGNPFGHGHTMTKGIVSAIGREISDLNKFPFIQTDASINPGNSGGPLVNLRGEVIGVNTAIDARAQGIGFAIPVDDVKRTITILEKDGIIRRGFLGVNMNPYGINPEAAREMGLPTTDGAMILGVVDGSPADQAGLKPYDLITKFNAREIKNSAEFSRTVGDAEVGGSYKVEYYRGSKKNTTTVKLQEHPDDLKEKQAQKKTYTGQKAPFDLGFSVTNWTPTLAKEFNLPRLKKNYPVVIAVEYDSPASKARLGVGDVIVDVNREEILRDVDVLRNLKKGQINSLRVLRGTTPILLYLQ